MITPKPTLLIADDSRTNLKILNEILRGEFDIKVATNGLEALERIQQTPHPELVLLDVQMPEMDGFQVCEKIKAKEGFKELPIIFITSLNDKSSVLKGFECGATDFISKPFEAEEVLARVRVHHQNIQLKLSLAEKAKEMEEFAYNAAHDLRAPLDLLDSYIDLMKHVENYESECTAKLSVASGNLRSLVNSLLTLAGVRGEDPLILEMSLKGMVETVCEELMSVVAEKEAKVEVLQDATILCDRTQMCIVLRNLISNGIKYSREGVTPLIQVGAEKVDEGILIRVQDNGSGFSDDVAEQLFQPFKRFHYNVQGHGLGLSICDKIIRLNGGSIQAKGVEGEGACFEVLWKV